MLGEVAAEAGVAPLVGGPVSLKAVLDLDWDDPEARTAGLVRVLAAVDALVRWLTTLSPAATATPLVQASLRAAQQVRTQHVEPGAGGLPRWRRGVSCDRRISLEDEQMRHGRKSRRVRGGLNSPAWYSHSSMLAADRAAG